MVKYQLYYLICLKIKQEEKEKNIFDIKLNIQIDTLGT